MRILITGGNGYIGQTLTRHLYATHDVTVVDALRQGSVRFAEQELPAVDQADDPSGHHPIDR